MPETDGNNLGTILTVWDRLRGTLLVEETAPDTTFGVSGEVVSYPQGWPAQFVKPFREIIRTGVSSSRVGERLANREP